MNQSNFRPVKYTKMTVWTSVFRKIDIQLAKKWPKMVVKLAIVIVICFDSEYTYQIQWHPCTLDRNTRISWLQIMFIAKSMLVKNYGSWNRVSWNCLPNSVASLHLGQKHKNFLVSSKCALLAWVPHNEWLYIILKCSPLLMSRPAVIVI